MRIAERRHRMVFGFYNTKPSYKEEQTGSYSYQPYLSRIVGAVETGLPPEEVVEPPQPASYDLAGEILNAFEYVLQYAASNNLGPTKSSRFYYLWSFSVAGAHQRVSSTSTVSGTKDGWNWDARFPLTGEAVSVWMLLTLEAIMPKFNGAYSTVTAFQALAAANGWDETMLESQKQSAKTGGGYDAWLTAYNSWWAGRQADGNVAAVVPPTNATLPNGAIRLDVALTVDPATFPHPESWTPLKVGASSQNYMTYGWEDVRSACLTAGNTTTIHAAADVYYPTTEQRQEEISEVVEITNTLSDSEKVSAEFWAGGPFTVSPPGMLMWFWKIYLGIESRRTLSSVIYSALDLALHLFETGRVVWGLKKAHMEARPIQEIRRLFRTQSVKKYDGTDISGASWVPYQETNFVTPPFADFPSGHSAFSRSFANVMDAWFGSSIDSSARVSMSDITLISPALAPQTQPYGTFVFGARASQIQTGVVPASDVTLTWGTWADLAQSAGLSRKYGGIHATSAHTGSVAAADALHTAIVANFPIVQ